MNLQTAETIIILLKHFSEKVNTKWSGQATLSYVLEHIERFSMDGTCRKKARSLSLDWAKCPSGMQDLFKTNVHPTPGESQAKVLELGTPDSQGT